MIPDPGSATAPTTLLKFLDWLRRQQSELWDHRERNIGGSGKIPLATGKARDDPDPAIVEINLHCPSPEYLIQRDFLDSVDKLCSPELIEEFLRAWPRIRFDIVRDLIQAMKWVENRICDEPKAALPSSVLQPAQTIKKKKSTGRGDARLKIVAALLRHHQYDKGSCLNQEPIGVNELARTAVVSAGSATNFFNRAFRVEKDGSKKYQQCCCDTLRLATFLKLLSGDFAAGAIVANADRPPRRLDSPDDSTGE
jgi:hypothetical protein